MPSNIHVAGAPRRLSRPSNTLIAGLIALAGIALQATTYPNHDVAWILYAARDMLHGAALGRDIIDSNPPLIFFLSLPVAALSEASGIAAPALFRAFVSLLCFGSLLASFLVLQRGYPDGGRRYAAPLAIAASYCFFVASYRDFAQREHLALVLCLPYVVMAGARMKGQGFAWPLAMAVGLAAGLGLAIKPYFLAAAVLVEALIVLRGRSLWPAFRPEAFAIAAVVLLYIAALFLFAPDYLHEVVPLLRLTYWGFENQFLEVLRPTAPALLGYLVAILLAWRQGDEPLIHVLLAAAGGFLFSYLWQMKGYTYQAYPFQALVGLALVCLVVHWFVQRQETGNRTPTRNLVLATGPLLVLVCVNFTFAAHWYRLANQPFGAKAALTERLVGLIDRHAAGDYFLALSTHPYPLHPIAIHSRAKSSSRSNSRLLLPAIAKLRSAGAETEAAKEALRSMEKRSRQYFLDDLSQEPKVVLVDAYPWKHGIGGDPFDILAFYMEDPRARDLWRDYREIAPISGYRIFLRNAAEQAP